MLICFFPTDFEDTKFAEDRFNIYVHILLNCTPVTHRVEGQASSLFHLLTLKSGSMGSISHCPAFTISARGVVGTDTCKDLPIHSFCMNDCALKLLEEVL